jgi:hypothetical protein
MRRMILAGVALTCFASCGNASPTGSVSPNHPPKKETGAESGAPPPNDFATLQSCSTEVCSARSQAQVIELTRSVDVPGLVCVLEALRDRRPGRYEHTTYGYWSNGGSDAEHVLVVSADGSVRYARSRSGQLVGPIPVFDPGEHCQLKPPSYFDGCLAALERYDQADPFSGPDNEAWLCAYGTLPCRRRWSGLQVAKQSRRCAASDQARSGQIIRVRSRKARQNPRVPHSITRAAFERRPHPYVQILRRANEAVCGQRVLRRSRTQRHER